MSTTVKSILGAEYPSPGFHWRQRGPLDVLVHETQNAERAYVENSGDVREIPWKLTLVRHDRRGHPCVSVLYVKTRAVAKKMAEAFISEDL